MFGLAAAKDILPPFHAGLTIKPRRPNMTAMIVLIIILLVGVHGWLSSIHQELKKMNSRHEELLSALKNK